MNSVVHKANTRGRADFGWLKANYSFSFARYFNPNRVQFGLLRVLNDDFIAPGKGFGTHPHQNMEIVTIPLKGALMHEDSMQHKEVIQPGEVQVMSAGSGITHSEYNASTTEETNILQLWVFTETQNVTPRYDQKDFSTVMQRNTFTTVVAPKNDIQNGALWVHQQAYFSIGEFDANHSVSYTLRNAKHGVYVFVIEGEITIENETLHKRDAIGIWNTNTATISINSEAKILLVEVPMQ